MTLSENKRILYKPENSDALIYKLHEIQNNNKDVTNDDEKIDPAELKKFFKKFIDHDRSEEKDHHYYSTKNPGYLFCYNYFFNGHNYNLLFSYTNSRDGK